VAFRQAWFRLHQFHSSFLQYKNIRQRELTMTAMGRKNGLQKLSEADRFPEQKMAKKTQQLKTIG